MDKSQKNKLKIEKEEDLKVAEAEEKVEKTEEQDTTELTEEERIAQLEAENSELRDKWLRVAAEFENYRRRSAMEKSDWIKNANQRLVLELCDVNDNFERAFENEEAQQDITGYKKGIEMIHKQIDSILKKEGVEKVKTLGEQFDPEYHEALAHLPSEKTENEVVAVIQNGYFMNGKVIRAARVAVSNGEKPVAPVEKKKKKKDKK